MKRKLNPFILIFVTLQFQAIKSALISTSERIVITKSSHFRPLVAKTYDQLIYVSFPFEFDLKIRLESEKIGYRPCEIIFPSNIKLEYPISLDSLANGKLVLGILTSDDRNLLSIIVNPDSCEFDYSLTRLINTNNDPVIVVGEEAYDIFLPNYVNCTDGKACRLRYNQKAELVGTTDFDSPAGAEGAWAITTIMEKDFAKGYFFTVFGSNQTIVRRLDQDLEVKAEKRVGKTFLYSDLFKQISSCRGISSSKLECQFLDDNLQMGIKIQLDAQPYRRYLRSAQLISLPSGGALLYLVLQLDGQFNFVSYLQKIDQHGRIGRALLFQDDVCKDIGKLSLTVSKMHEDLICLSLSCRYSIHTKCVAFDD